MTEHNKRIIVTDDEKAIGDILAHFLGARGYDVTTACSGEQALEIIHNQGADLLITDLKMDGMSGVDLLKWVKEFDNRIPVIMTTGFPSMSSAIDGLKLGAYDYITKPFHLEEIGEKVKRALQVKQMEEDNCLFSKLVPLHEVTRVLATTLDTTKINDQFLHYATRLANADGGTLLFLNNESNLVIVQSTGDFNQQFWHQKLFLDASKRVINYGEPMMMESVIDDLFPLPPELGCCVVFPLKTSKIIGTLILVRLKDRNVFSNIDLEILNVIVSQASISIENARLYKNQRNNYLETIRAFALAVEAKDLYTHGHSENVMKYNVLVAKQLGLPAADIELVKYAGLLHDIGKIGVSEMIINKPGKLTTEEYDQVKKHPEQGARIISNVPSLVELVPLVYHHHEFFAGGGYPAGIAGDQIPYGARILSVSDAFEAMTSNRPYRKQMPKDVALDILDKEKGKQFDPSIVEAFLEVMKSDL